jgi:hypothetical protein
LILAHLGAGGLGRREEGCRQSDGCHETANPHATR